MPSTPRLFALGKEIKDRKLVVPLPDGEMTVTIECLASNGIPPPDFVWKLNDAQLHSMPVDDKLPREYLFQSFFKSHEKQNILSLFYLAPCMGSELTSPSLPFIFKLDNPVLLT